MKFYLFNTHLEHKWYASGGFQKKFTFALSENVKITKLSFLIINNSADDYIYIGKIYNKRKVTTYDNSISVKDVVQIDINLDELIRNTQGKRANKILKSKEPISLLPDSDIHVKNAILKANIGTLRESYFTFERLIYSQFKDIFPEFVDSLNIAFNIFGFDPRDIPPLTEEQILDFDIDTMFPNKLVLRTADGRHCFYHNKKKLYLQKVHNTPIERCLGVDLIYNFIEEQRILFIQYKCLNKNGKFYKSSDSHLGKVQMDKMKSIPSIEKCHNLEVSSRKSLRICNCPVFIKLCSREIREHRTAPHGFYYPICIWDHIYSEDNKFITLNDQPRISNGQFLQLVKDGLLGSTPAQSKKIESYLVSKVNDNRLRLVFTESEDDVNNIEDIN